MPSPSFNNPMSTCIWMLVTPVGSAGPQISLPLLSYLPAFYKVPVPVPRSGVLPPTSPTTTTCVDLKIRLKAPTPTTTRSTISTLLLPYWHRATSLHTSSLIVRIFRDSLATDINFIPLQRADLVSQASEPLRVIGVTSRVQALERVQLPALETLSSTGNWFWFPANYSRGTDALFLSIVWVKPPGESDGTSNTSSVRYDTREYFSWKIVYLRLNFPL